MVLVVLLFGLQKLSGPVHKLNFDGCDAFWDEYLKQAVVWARTPGSCMGLYGPPLGIPLSLLLLPLPGGSMLIVKCMCPDSPSNAVSDDHCGNGGLSRAPLH